MTYNPYGAPAAQGPIAPQVPAGPPGMPQPWEAGEVVSRAWDIFKVHWVPLVFGTMIGSAAASAPQQIGSIYNVVAHGPGGDKYPIDDPIWVALAVGGGVIGWVLQAFFQAGFTKMYATAARGAAPEFAHVFSGAPHFFRMLGAMFLQMFLIMLGMIFFLVPGIILALGLMLTPYYVVDRGMGPIEAMKASWAATTGEKGKLFVLGLYWLGIMILGMLACCVGILPAIATMGLTQAIVYCRLTGTESTFSAAPPAPPGAYGPYGGGYGGYGPPPQQPPGGYNYGPPPGGYGPR